MCVTCMHRCSASVNVFQLSVIHNKFKENYGSAHIQVYKQMCITRRASRNFEDNSRVGLVRHQEYTACERLLMI